MKLAGAFAVLILAVEVMTPKAADTISWLGTSTMLVVPLLAFFAYMISVMIVDERKK